MQWWDVLGVAGEGLTVIGFVATLYQVRKTRNATRAVEQVVFEHLLQARRGEIVQNLEDLQPIPPQTRRAVQLTRWNQVAELLRAWRQHGYTVCLHHRRLGSDSDDDELVQRLEASFKVTEDARMRVLARSGDMASLAESIESAVLEMEAVADLIPFSITEVRNFKPMGLPASLPARRPGGTGNHRTGNHRTGNHRTGPS
jgi:hypothetical protein